MAKPLPKLVIPPAAPSKQAGVSYAKLRSLWIQAGGDPNLASTMAAIALAESGGKVGIVSGKNTNGTVDRGLWQINSSHGYNATQLTTDPLFNARAAVAIYNSQGLPAWTTYTSNAYTAFYKPTTPQEKAQATVTQGTVTATTKSQSPTYQEAQAHEAQVAADARIQGNIEVETATRAAKATAHITDPWVTLTMKGGKVVGFGETYGAAAPANVLMIGGQPATRSLYQQAWSNVYASDYAAYTGNQATPAVQAKILQSGVSAWALKEQLSKQPGFVASPIYKANGPGIADQAKQILGTAPPPGLVRQAIAQGWDTATFQAHLRALPQYTKGTEFRNNIAQNQTTYEGIYGKADPEAQQWLKHVTVQGWAPDAVGHALRSDPAYKYSPEFQAKAVSFLDAIGAITGTQAVTAPSTTPQAVKQQTANSKVGGPPTALTTSTVGG